MSCKNEKVQLFDGWNSETAKQTPCSHNQQITEGHNIPETSKTNTRRGEWSNSTDSELEVTGR